MIDSITLDECPVGMIAPESRRLVEIMARADFAKQASGSALYGANLSKWPVRMVDASVVIQQERNREANARARADIEDIKTNG